MDDLQSLTLIVKAPNQRIEDQRVACDCTWTVKQLKEHLSFVHPEKPHKDKQKLVYFGKLLNDDSCLKEVLTQDSYDDAHTVHLVCPSLAFTDSSKPYIPRYSTPTAHPQQVNELRQRLAPSGEQPPSQPTPVTPEFTQQWNSSNWSQMFPTQTQQSDMTAQQRLWQQVYQQQWMQYNMIMQQQLQAQHIHTSAASVPAAAVPQQEEAPEDAQPPVAAPGEVVRMNAQGGVDAAGGQHDWLDTIYAFVRFGMLLLLLYFYTTMGRFAIVILVGVFFYVAQGNMFRNLFRLQRRRPEAREAPQQPPQNEQNQAENQNNENSERYQSEAGNSEPNNPATVEENDSSWLDAVKIAFTFIITFFTSIIPQDPAALAN